MKTLINNISIALVLLFLPLMALAQPSYYTLSENSTMVIKGTSTIHDWEADVEEMDVTIALAPDRLQKESMNSPVESFSIVVPVKSIESGKGRMNRKIYEALEEENYPQINFELVSAEINGENSSMDSFKLNATGTLTIKGNAKEVSFPVQVTRIDENSFRFEGSYSLNMENYEVDPPSAMFGTIKSGEEVEIVFNILVTQ